MSKNFKGYLGDQIGKLGTAVGRRWKRKMIYSAYQGRVSNPRTDDQLMVRARFSLLVHLSAIFTAATRKGLRQMAQNRQCTEDNCFVSLNYPRVSGNSPESVALDPSRVVISRGSLPGVVYGATLDASTTPDTVVVGISAGNSDQAGASASDKVYAFLYCPDAEGGVLSQPASRTGNKIEVSVPASWSGLEVHAYGFTVGGGSSNQGKASATEYIGHATLS